MADVQVKLEQEEMDQLTEQEKVMNNTEHDNASAAADQVAILNNAEVGGQNNDNIMNNNEGGRYDGDINGDMWELEDINEMDTALAAREFLGGYDNVGGGGWGEWKYDGGETWREWEFAAANNYYQDNDWVIEDLWVFDDHHYPNDSNGANNNGGGGGAAANPRDPQA